MNRYSKVACIVMAQIIISGTAWSAVTKEDVLEAFDRVLAKLPPAEAAELESLRPKFEALDDSYASRPTVRSTEIASGSTSQEAVALGEVDSGDLGVSPAGAPSCPTRPLMFLKGEQVRVSGEGYAPSTDVSITFGSGDYEADLGSITTDGNGILDGVVAMPTGDTAEYPPQAVGLLEATGASLSGTLWLSVAIEIGTMTGDTDGDGIPDYCDTCPDVPNPDNSDQDGDRLGDACDPCPNGQDTDGDGLCDSVDACKFDPANDVDDDGVCGNDDNCPTVPNPDQADSDKNGIGDACQTQTSCADGIDNDGDGLIDGPPGWEDPSPSNDPGCIVGRIDHSELGDVECDDGIDNDGDGFIDARLINGDPGCESPASLSESPECNDHIDNDGDGRIDFDGHYGLTGIDYDCAGLGYHDSETVPVPEPSVCSGLMVGIGSLALLGRRRQDS